jgi:hypothetical protein
LYDAAFKYSNKIICCDSDEYLDGTLTKQELEEILDQTPDTTFFLQWVQYTDINTIRVDGPWANNFKVRIGSYTTRGDFGVAQMHSLHLPQANKQQTLDPNKLFIAHLQWLDKRWVGVKQYFWKINDYVNKMVHGAQVIEAAAYDASVNNFNWEYAQFSVDLKVDPKIYSTQNIKNNYKLQYIKKYTQELNIPDLGDWGMGIYKYATEEIKTSQQNIKPMYFCTAGDDIHFNAVLNLISSIHKHNYKETEQIAVFNLGFSKENIDTLKKIQKVKVYEVEKINPLIVEPLYNCPGRWIRGLFSWKPVVIKQALQMFPYVVYADAGTTFNKPLNDLFEHIINQKYFISDCGHSIKWMTTKFIINKLNLNNDSQSWILNDDVFGIDAGFMGVTKEIEECFINPVYELAKDIHNFIDDGTCPQGWGTGRHDQTLFSIFARKLNLNILNHDREIEECFLTVGNKKIPFHLTHNGDRFNSNTVVFRCRKHVPLQIFNDNARFLKFK